MEGIKGAIIGDIVGSRFEFNNIKHKSFDLFDKTCKITDDTVMTIAIADAVLMGSTKDNFIKILKKWGKKYPNAGYGVMFYSWVLGTDTKAYNSCGNGSAMRISPVAESIDINLDESEALNQLENRVMTATAITHNHPEGIKGAMVTAELIWHCNKYRMHNEGLDIDELKEKLKSIVTKKYHYDISIPLDNIRTNKMQNSLSHSETCQDTVPIALRSFFEAKDFEDCIRNTISVGGDSDTIADIAGAIAGALYTVPKDIWDNAKTFLTDEMIDILNRFEKQYK